MVTIKDIANHIGVSRGTVDRVLNNRPGVRKDTREKILQAVKELNYVPNVAGKNLSNYKKDIKLAYVYFDYLPATIRIHPHIVKRVNELEQMGISTQMYPCEPSNYEQENEILEKLRTEGISGLVVTPVQHPSVASKLRQMADEGIAIVTIHADLADCGRIAYVGNDYYRLGRMAANVLGLCCGQTGALGTVVNFPQVYHHEVRLAGFREKMKASFPEITLMEPYYNYADINVGYVATREFLKQHRDVNALFLECTYVEGICKAVEESGRKISLVAFDDREEVRKYVRSGLIAALIVQHASYQAQKPFDILYHLLVFGTKPEKEVFFVPAEIKIAENL